MEYSFHCVNINHCDWFNKEVDWSIARLERVIQENQTKIMLKRRAESQGLGGDTG